MGHHYVMVLARSDFFDIGLDPNATNVLCVGQCVKAIVVLVNALATR